MIVGMRSTTRLGRALDHGAAHFDLLPTRVLRAEGLSPRQISALADDGVIERIIRGLYRTAGSRTPLQDIAAALHRHPHAAASHTSALFVHGLEVVPPDPPHLTMPPGSASAITLGVLHRSPLGTADRTRRQRLPVTTIARSIVDAAELLTVDELAAVVNEAISRKMVTIPLILEAAHRVERAPGRIGSGRFREVLATWTEAIRPDSVAEAAAIRRIRRFGLPAPVTQHEVFDEEGTFVARLDMAWPEQQVAREYDSIEHHGPERTEPDERRTQALEALGWSVDSVYRHHLLPGEVAWLEQLRDDLRGSRSAAS